MAYRSNDYSAFHVPLSQHLFSGLLHGTRGLRNLLSNLESHVLREQLDKIELRRPIYIAGLPRAGTTILLEVVSSHPDVVTHRYRDFWTIYTPFWSEQAMTRHTPRHNEPVERSHGDRLMVTPDSPEAMEEILWMAFFSGLHDPARCNVLDDQTEHPRFERFYRDHIRKLLLARNGRRYASKANYNVTRLEYLLKLYPDTRIVIPVRQPRQHVSSLCKQHTLLAAAAQAHPRSLSYLDRVGHFEFGQHRRPINAGDEETIRSIQSLWQRGFEVRGWARYWAYIYGYLANSLQANRRLHEAVLLVRYEDLCAEPNNVLCQLFGHCDLEDSENLVRQFRERMLAPTYYQPQFTAEEERAIVEETADVARGYGYEHCTQDEAIGDRAKSCMASPAPD
jgi:hypothetical protein